jgi:SAM-dependent methyltransferase
VNGRRSDLRDRRLEREVAELLAHDERLRGLRVEVRFGGGVAHACGNVASQEQRVLLREQIARLRDVHAVWDRISVDGRPALRILDVGCGATKQYPGTIGLDRHALPAVDVVADVLAGLPLRDGAVDRILAVHVLEHLADVVGVMNELHRVLAPGGVLHAMSPDRLHVNAYADPTHIRFFDVQTFKYFCTRHPAVRPWWPHLVSTDGASVFADLSPVPDGGAMAPAEHLARFFD